MTAVTALSAVIAGCSSATTEAPDATPAGPQRATVDWVEPAPANGPGLVFEVRTIEVTEQGWRAEVAIRNRSEIAWEIDPKAPSSFGVMLFATGELGELEQRNADQSLPGLRPARRLEPAHPSRLGAGDAWEGTMSAPGALAAGRWLRVVFGPLFAGGEAPEGLPDQLVWITDNTYRLRPATTTAAHAPS
jgi:hypothetical protein